MKIQIRNNIFETNSSSIHAICIPTEKNIKYPDTCEFCTDQYGWGPSIENNVGNYLYTALICLGKENELKKLKELLDSKNIETFFEDTKSQDFGSFYIDHDESLNEFIDYLFEDDERLLSFLFSKKSKVYIYNDNDDYEAIINDIKEQEKDNSTEIYYKYN